MIDMEALVSTVQTYLDAHGVGAVVTLGWAEQGKQTNQGTGGANRVVFVPLSGSLEATQHPGGNPQSLYDDVAEFEVRVWAIDRSTPQAREDHVKQAAATKRLLHWVVRAVSGHNRPADGDTFVHTYAGAEEWGAYTWTADPIENAFGRELRAPLTLRYPISDVSYETFEAGFALTKDIRPETEEP